MADRGKAFAQALADELDKGTPMSEAISKANAVADGQPAATRQTASPRATEGAIRAGQQQQRAAKGREPGNKLDHRYSGPRQGGPNDPKNKKSSPAQKPQQAQRPQAQKQAQKPEQTKRPGATPQQQKPASRPDSKPAARQASRPAAPSTPSRQPRGERPTAATPVSTHERGRIGAERQQQRQQQPNQQPRQGQRAAPPRQETAKPQAAATLNDKRGSQRLAGTNYTAQDLHSLASMVVGEAGNQPQAGKLGVAESIRNRAEKLDKPIDTVMRQRGQYDAVLSRGAHSKTVNATVRNAKDHPQYNNAMKAARDALVGRTNEVRGATSYYNAKTATDKNFVSKMDKVPGMKIGDHTFKNTNDDWLKNVPTAAPPNAFSKVGDDEIKSQVQGAISTQGQATKSSARGVEGIGRGISREAGIDPDATVKSTGATVTHSNQRSNRSGQIDQKFQDRISEVVGSTLGQGYTADVYSGIGNTPEEAKNSQHKAHKSGAADITIRGPDGKLVGPDDLAKVGAAWSERGYGGVGHGMNPSKEKHAAGIHLDQRGSQANWSYGKSTKEQMDTIRGSNFGSKPNPTPKGPDVQSLDPAQKPPDKIDSELDTIDKENGMDTRPQQQQRGPTAPGERAPDRRSTPDRQAGMRATPASTGKPATRTAEPPPQMDTKPRGTGQRPSTPQQIDATLNEIERSQTPATTKADMAKASAATAQATPSRVGESYRAAEGKQISAQRETAQATQRQAAQNTLNEVRGSQPSQTSQRGMDRATAATAKSTPSRVGPSPRAVESRMQGPQPTAPKGPDIGSLLGADPAVTKASPPTEAPAAAPQQAAPAQPQQAAPAQPQQQAPAAPQEAPAAPPQRQEAPALSPDQTNAAAPAPQQTAAAAPQETKAFGGAPTEEVTAQETTLPGQATDKVAGAQVASVADPSVATDAAPAAFSGSKEAPQVDPNEAAVRDTQTLSQAEPAAPRSAAEQQQQYRESQAAPAAAPTPEGPQVDPGEQKAKAAAQENMNLQNDVKPTPGHSPFEGGVPPDQRPTEEAAPTTPPAETPAPEAEAAPPATGRTPQQQQQDFRSQQKAAPQAPKQEYAPVAPRQPGQPAQPQQPNTVQGAFQQGLDGMKQAGQLFGGGMGGMNPIAGILGGKSGGMPFAGGMNPMSMMGGMGGAGGLMGVLGGLMGMGGQPGGAVAAGAPNAYGGGFWTDKGQIDAWGEKIGPAQPPAGITPAQTSPFGAGPMGMLSGLMGQAQEVMGGNPMSVLGGALGGMKGGMTPDIGGLLQGQTPFSGTPAPSPTPMGPPAAPPGPSLEDAIPGMPPEAPAPAPQSMDQPPTGFGMPSQDFGQPEQDVGMMQEGDLRDDPFSSPFGNDMISGNEEDMGPQPAADQQPMSEGFDQYAGGPADQGEQLAGGFESQQQEQPDQSHFDSFAPSEPSANPNADAEAAFGVESGAFDSGEQGVQGTTEGDAFEQRDPDDKAASDTQTSHTGPQDDSAGADQAAEGSEGGGDKGSDGVDNDGDGSTDGADSDADSGSDDSDSDSSTTDSASDGSSDNTDGGDDSDSGSGGA